MRRSLSWEGQCGAVLIKLPFFLNKGVHVKRGAFARRVTALPPTSSPCNATGLECGEVSSEAVLQPWFWWHRGGGSMWRAVDGGTEAFYN